MTQKARVHAIERDTNKIHANAKKKSKMYQNPNMRCTLKFMPP